MVEVEILLALNFIIIHIIANLYGILLRARLCSKLLACIIFLDPRKNLMTQGLVLISFADEEILISLT